MKRTVLALALCLGGCATLQTDWNIITGATVSPQAVLVAANSFDALEVTATNYLTFCKTNRALPVCAGYVGARKQILPAVRAGRVARNNLENFLQQHPGQLGPSGLYDTLTAAITTLQGVISQYNVTGAK